jgi:hypothetical protein
MEPTGRTLYFRACGWTLAPRARQTRGPDRYHCLPGHHDGFDRSIADFSERYANQNDQDYDEFVNAIRSGRLEALEGVELTRRAPDYRGGS